MAEKTVSLKLMIDTKAKKVVFAEADKPFVDFLIQLMSLPLSSVSKLVGAQDNAVVALFKSIESLNSDHFEPNVLRESALKPNPSGVPMLHLYGYPTTLKLYKCVDHNCVSDFPGVLCSYNISPTRYSKRCNKEMSLVSYDYASPSNCVPPGYVKRGLVFMVMDNLEVKPMSIALIKSTVKELHDLEEKTVIVDSKQALAILKASLETKAVLTTVFLG